MKISLVILLLIVLAALLALAQRRMIYFPRAYPTSLPLPAGALVLEFTTSQGRQTAFYLPPAAPQGEGGSNLWLLCGGNGALALDWLDLVSDFPDHSAAFLLLDYPGYGRCQGRPGPAAIREATEQALVALAARLGRPLPELRENLSGLGHSLGAAAVLLYAARHPVKQLVLVAPFTSLKEMATLVVGPLLARTLLHDYDNRARLREVLARQPEVPITIIHGSHDKIVPVAMGRELAGLSPRIVYREIDRGDHNYILLTNRTEIRQAMLGHPLTGPDNR
jgi:pimeloyl-ACP methyl ester carboxylesterase